MNVEEVVRRVLETVVDLDIDGVAAQVRQALQAGAAPLDVLNDGLSAGMRAVGERFEAGEYYLTELVLAGEVMKEGLAPLEPLLKEADVRGKGTIVLATVKGDIHNIGKNLVGTMLRAAGFEVVDLGTDVPAARIVEAVQQHGAGVVALSVLLTPMVGQLQTVAEAFTEAGRRSQVKIVIGGACTTPRLAEEMGCDAYGPDAVAAVRICEGLLAD
ncbi:MAG: cobalamin-dependent protein [Chloroflexi bacterium]|nr:cobalamin-dependent protein [Chloroflexota bacterium]